MFISHNRGRRGVGVCFDTCSHHRSRASTFTSGDSIPGQARGRAQEVQVGSGPNSEDIHDDMMTADVSAWLRLTALFLSLPSYFDRFILTHTIILLFLFSEHRNGRAASTTYYDRPHQHSFRECGMRHGVRPSTFWRHK